MVGVETAPSLTDLATAGGCAAKYSPARLEELFEAAGGDGFLLNIDYSLSSIRDFVERVVPILQAHGIYRSDYAGATLREHVQQDD